MRKGLTYDDVLIVPQRSPVSSRSEVQLNSRVTPSISCKRPFISSPMDTVTESEMANGMNENGGIGIIHRNMEIDEQVEEVKSVEEEVGGAVGIGNNSFKRAEKLVDSGDVSFLCLDIAHGHMEDALNMVSSLESSFEVDIMAGTVATAKGAADLYENGADAIRVGVGPGSHCKTREVAGVGVPQWTAVKDTAQRLKNKDATIIADGGIRKPGDAAKALLVGADTVIMGGLLAGSKESPAEKVTIRGNKYKKTRGMASSEAREELLEKGGAVEGVEGLVTYTKSVGNTLERIAKGVRSAVSYTGYHSLEQARFNARFIEITPSTQQMNGHHSIQKRD